MSRTYKYPRKSLEDLAIRNEPLADLRIKKKLERQKKQKRKKIKLTRSFKKMISFRDKQRARM